MPETDNLDELPGNIPVPVDDGACKHLLGIQLCSIPLPSTSGHIVDLASILGRTVVYCYPRTGRPNIDLPRGWDEIPGARGCTPQSCAFKAHYQEFTSLDIGVFGLSTQNTDYQKEAAERLYLPFELLSDAELTFTYALRLPTFQVESITLIKRLTLILLNGRIEKVFYPVFPPNENVEEVIVWSQNPLD